LFSNATIALISLSSAKMKIMKIICLLGIVCFLSGCAKDTVKEEQGIACLFEPAWLSAKKIEYGNCSCLTEIRTGVFNNRQVFEVRAVDPLCNGINQVYSTDGSILLTSADQPIYQQYLAALKDERLYWSCSKANGG
jgi:hypothetical protein